MICLIWDILRHFQEVILLSSYRHSFTSVGYKDVAIMSETTVGKAMDVGGSLNIISPKREEEKTEMWRPKVRGS